MSDVPGSMVLACLDQAADTACDGVYGSGWIAIQYLQSSAWVGYEVSTSGGCGALAPYSFGNLYAPVSALPAGACVYVTSSQGNFLAPFPNGFAAPSSLVFGGGAIYSPPFDVSQLDAPSMGYAFSAGFLLVAMGFFIGKPIQLLLSAIRSW